LFRLRIVLLIVLVLVLLLLLVPIPRAADRNRNTSMSRSRSRSRTQSGGVSSIGNLSNCRAHTHTCATNSAGDILTPLLFPRRSKIVALLVGERHVQDVVGIKRRWVGGLKRSGPPIADPTGIVMVLSDLLSLTLSVGLNRDLTWGFVVVGILGGGMCYGRRILPTTRGG
jgi:hypothetical protein